MLQLAEITEVEVLDLDKVSLEFFEEVTNPKILNYKVNMLSYERVNFDLLNDSIIKNISLIGPKDLHLSGLNLNSNPIRILSNLPENITVNFNFNFVEDITFKFSNSEIRWRDHKGTSTLYGRNVWFKYGLNDFYSDDVLFLDNKYICIWNWKNMIITNFKKKNETTKFSPEILSMINSKCENYFIITVNSLSEIRLNASKFTRLLSNELNKKYFSALSSSTKIVISLESLKEIVKFNEMSSYVPKHCELQFYVSVYSYLYTFYLLCYGFVDTF